MVLKTRTAQHSTADQPHGCPSKSSVETYFTQETQSSPGIESADCVLSTHLVFISTLGIATSSSVKACRQGS